MPRGYDALRDVLANSPTHFKPHITNLLNDPRPHRASLSPVLHSAPLTPALTHSSRPGSSDSASSPPMLPVEPSPTVLPYNPIKRRTPPTSVLIPLTPAELESFKIPRHALRVRAQRPDPALENPNFFPASLRHPDTAPQRKANSKRKREDDDDEKALKRSRDSGLVVEHCEYRPLLS